MSLLLSTENITPDDPVVPTLMPLPSCPGQIVSVEYFGPLSITQNGNKHILLYTGRFSRHIAAYAVTQDERTAE